MDYQITKLLPQEFFKCADIWNVERQKHLAEQFEEELRSGNRVTYICQTNDECIGEISLVFHRDDPDYTIRNQRVYVSHLVVKPEYRRRGIGKALVRFITKKAEEFGYREMSIGVDLDNYPALKLYIACGFDHVIYIGKDGQGAYLKLLKTISVPD